MKEITLSKPYFRRYSHRVEINHFYSVVSQGVSRKGKVFERKARFYDASVHDRVIKLCKEITNDFRSRHNGYGFDSNTVVFFKDATIFEKLQAEFPDQIASVERPKNEDHFRAVSVERYVVRPTLFYGKYRCRITLKSNKVSRRDSYWSRVNRTEDAPKKRWDEMEKWIKQYMARMGRNDTDNVYVNPASWEPIIFFANPADAAMFKLTWGDDIRDFQRAKLTSEL